MRGSSQRTMSTTFYLQLHWQSSICRSTWRHISKQTNKQTRYEYKWLTPHTCCHTQAHWRASLTSHQTTHHTHDNQTKRLFWSTNSFVCSPIGSSLHHHQSSWLAHPVVCVTNWGWPRSTLGLSWTDAMASTPVPSCLSPRCWRECILCMASEGLIAW